MWLIWLQVYKKSANDVVNFHHPRFISFNSQQQKNET